MATPSQIISGLTKGWNRFVGMSYKAATDAQTGCGCCGNKLWPCLFSILKGLQWRVDMNVFDEVTSKLYDEMLEIVGYDPTPIVDVVIEFGYFDAKPIPSDGMVLPFGIPVSPSATEYTIDFTDSANMKYLVVKEPLQCPLKTQWDNTTFNYGTIPDQVWDTVLEDVENRFYVTRVRLPLQLGDSDIKFKV